MIYYNDNYSYNPSKTFKIRKYQVHPLNDEGFSQYISKRSFNHNYVTNKFPNFYSNIAKNTDEITYNTVGGETLKMTDSVEMPKETMKSRNSSTCIKPQTMKESRKELKREILKNSYTTFQKLNKEVLGNSPKIISKTCIGFRPDNVPRTNDNFDFYQKEKWKVSNPQRMLKDLYLSSELSSRNTENSQSPKEKVKLPKIRKFQTSNKVNANKFFGEKYNPFNYEIQKEKKNTCSLRESFKQK